MPTMANIALFMRTALRDPTGTGAFWPDAELFRLYDNAHKVFVAVAPASATREFQVKVEINTSAAAGSLSYGEALLTGLASPFFQVRFIQIRQVATSNFYTAEIVPLEALLVSETPGHPKATEPNPIAAVWGTSIYHAPALAAVVAGMRVFYTSVPTELTASGDTPGANAIFHYSIADLALFHAFQKIGEFNQAQLHLSAFGSFIVGLGGKWDNQAYMDRLPERKIA